MRSRARSFVVVAGLLAGWMAAAGAQERPARLYRLVQAGAEVGRESYRFAGGVVERSVLVPLLDLKLDSRGEYDSAGRFVQFSGRIYNASGDSARFAWLAEAVGDSLRVTSGLRQPRTVVSARVPEGIVPSQSITVLAEVAERSRGRDTTFRFMPMGLDSLVPVAVRHGGDTVYVELAGIVGYVLRTGTIVVPAQRLVATPYDGGEPLPELAGLRRPARDYAAPPGAPYTPEEVRIAVRSPAGDTFTLAGTLTLPVSGRPPFPVVVTMSGSGRQDRDENLWPLLERYRPFREIAERLARAGIAVLRYDDRGEGGSSGPPGTTADYARDVNRLVEWLRARPDMDGRRVAVLGHSEGGAMGPLAAAEDPLIAAVVILAGPAKSGREIVRDQFRRPIEVAEGLSPEERARQLADVERRLDEWVGVNEWSRWFAAWDPLETARRLRMPVLILHGALDRQVSVGQADTLAAAIRGAGNRDVTVRIFPRLNHLFLPTPGDGSPAEYPGLVEQSLPSEVLDEIAAWLLARLGRVPAGGRRPR